MEDKITLICTPLTFYTPNDEDSLFTWLDKVKSIESYKGIGEELHIYISTKKIPDQDLLDLFGIFDRYKFNASQLKIFMNQKNKDWFDDI